MSFLDEIFGTDETPIKPLMTPAQREGQKELLGASLPLATDYLSKAGQPYPGDMTTGYEQQGLDILGNYLSSPLPTESEAYKGAMGELEKTFGNEYDPVGGEYYQAYRTAVLRELEESKDRLAAKTSASDKYFGGGRIKETSNLEEGATNNLALVLGQLFENERSRKLQAVPLAQQMLGYGEQAQTNRVGASQAYGGLEFEREYGEYLRQMQELGIPLQTALTLSTAHNQFYQPSYEPSFYERIIMPTTQAAAMGAMAM